eukprot:GEZU01007414.1.p1 GENE.GEZU01007414.1~~GEZU01007414.1.p1  ORF type:complete len:300 (-),score=60.67 GEZU01007414.1:129-1028(-)
MQKRIACAIVLLLIVAVVVAPMPTPTRAAIGYVANADADTGWNQSTMMTMLTYSAIAYDLNFTQIEDWTCGYCHSVSVENFDTTLVFDYTSTETMGYIGVDKEAEIIVVAFRGSQYLVNWITDLTACTVTDYNGIKGAKVHTGFYLAYNNVKDQVVAEVQRLTQLYPQFEVAVTGHSLGAALATLCAADLAGNRNIRVSQFYNFGSPRVGNDAFVTFFVSNVPNAYRVVNEDDPVPHLPPQWLEGFHHVPREVWFHHDEFKVCDDSGEDPTCSDSVHITDYLKGIPEHINYFGINVMPQ